MSPIEVWLRQDNLTISCTVVRPDESTYDIDVDSLSMRGAQREITGYLISEGYIPLARWTADALNPDGPAEVHRMFKLPAV